VTKIENVKNVFFTSMVGRFSGLETCTQPDRQTNSVFVSVANVRKILRRKGKLENLRTLLKRI